MGGFPRESPQKFRETKSRLRLNNFTQKLDFDVLWCRRQERTRFRKKEKEKTEREEKKRKNKEKKNGKKEKKTKKNLMAAKSGLVGIKEYIKTYNRVKYFLPYLSRF